MSFVSRNHPQQIAVRGALDEVDDRGTPQDFFDELSQRFGPFTLDVAAAPHNAKCEKYYTRADDGLLTPWYSRQSRYRSEVVWCNPPYSNLDAWLRKAWDQWDSDAIKRIVMLLPANRPEQPWWQKHVEPFRDRRDSSLRTEFLPGRLRFIKPGQTEIRPNERPPFGCVLLIWDNANRVAS